jgi:hypothetical protein
MVLPSDPLPNARVMPEISEPSPQTRTTLFKLQARQCRFIVSNDQAKAIFCGSETQEGSSWCPWHRCLVYTTPVMAGPSAGKRSA